MNRFKPNDALLVRWLAIAGAGGAATAAAFAHFKDNPLWATCALIAALLAAAGIAGLWRAFHLRNRALDEYSHEQGEQKREVSALQQELEIHRQLERELTEAKQAAESAMMAKGEFLATMSHEIRTPLNGIIPMLDLLMASRLPPDQHDILRTAYTSARQMLRIVDDILDYSKLEANKLQLESTSFNLRELIDSVIRLMEKPAEAKGLRLSLQIDAAVRLPVRGDPVRLRQILTNLISNAVKFTERGAVSLQITRKGETRTQHELRFEVRDTGIGIARQNAQNLFRAFSQADASTTRLYGGTGLGLVICKRIVDLMGGTMGVDSEPGRGSIFWFEIPLLKASGDIQNQRADLNGARILLLSNDAAVRQRLQKAMPDWGAQLTESEATQDALTQLRTAITRGNNWAFDLLIVDLQSVRATAIALHRNLRRTPELEDLRVIYLQGSEPAAPELAAGGHALMLPRAIGNVEFRTAVNNFLSAPVVIHHPEPEPAPAPPPEPAPREPSDPAPAPKLRGRVLLVEDNPVNQMVAQRLIGMLGLSCETADNGEKALERMNAGHLDLVLMDCQMPVKDGYSAAREWRQHEAAHKLPRLPIIAMTANAMAGDRQKCLDSGMDDYLSKPVDRRLLESSLARWLLKSPAALVAPAKSAAPVAPVAAAPGPVATPAPAAAAPATARVAPAPAAPPAPVVARPVAAPQPLPAAPEATPPAPVRRPLPSPPLPEPATAMPPIQPFPARATPPGQAPAPARVATPMPAAAPPPAAEAPAPPPPVLAMEVLDELKTIMGQEYLGLVKLFLEDAPNHIQQLETAAATNDIAGLVAPAHTLKSSSANLGALALSAAAKRIELGARTGALPRATVAVLMLETEFQRARTALQALFKPPG
ncbi:hybrid sensor histidine kinase/response regulator [Arenimonas oryziterrae]|uniref:Sensory/regulatory protein RpfC n=1 Tax=Arenimonas oryziterrae DSM 21050 = YC6267 TaxID=1121015 RepID=A0A091AQG8_9GAMM|nr:hybrid sensor histidine kinase/response regulator [Arenimonas oryziterrae]KFN42408.1 hypothetical protein N789_13710 [Arenimonas oryziterrae DSM 21050 = YC6267]